MNRLSPSIDSHSFTISSVDNWNKRSCYATVKASDSHRGFDGTSVQLVQPNPCHLFLFYIYIYFYYFFFFNKNDQDTFEKKRIILYNTKKNSYTGTHGSSMVTFYRAILVTLFKVFLTSERYIEGILKDQTLNMLGNSKVNKLRDNC